MAAFVFDYHVVPRNPTTHCEYISTLRPLLGKFKLPDMLIPRLKRLQARWRMRASDLTDHGWAPVQSKLKLAYAHNCPPCSVQVDPQTQRCRLRICPFCHSRRISMLFQQIQALQESNPDIAKAKILSYRAGLGRKQAEWQRIRYDADGSCTAMFEQEILGPNRQVGAKFRSKWLKDAYFTASSCSFAPFTFINRAADESVGLWWIEHNMLAAVPPDWEPKKWAGSTIVDTSPPPFRLSYLVGHTFRYCPLWMTADPTVVASMLNSLHRVRLFKTTGALREHEGNVHEGVRQVCG